MKRIILALYISIFCFSTSLNAEAVQRIEVNATELSWSRIPRFKFSNTDLKGKSRNISFKFEANEKGEITFAEIEKSSGLENLDNKMLEAFKVARLKPYHMNGVIYPVRSIQHYQIWVNPLN